MLTWEISSDWRHDPSIQTEVEVRFSPEGTSTRVDLEHRLLQYYGDKVAQMRGIFESEKGLDGAPRSLRQPGRWIVVGRFSRVGRDDMLNITSARKVLVARILEGDGMASGGQRRAAFDNAGLPEPLRTLIDKVAKRAYTVTDQDIAAAKASGLSEDQIFELAVCAAVGQATRQYDAALAALAAATEGNRHASRNTR